MKSKYTAKQLIKELQEYDEETPVFFQMANEPYTEFDYIEDIGITDDIDTIEEKDLIVITISR